VIEEDNMVRKKLLCIALIISIVLATFPTTSASTYADVAYATHATGSLTQGQINIVMRARQVYEFEWTPLRNVVKWGGNSFFPAGVPVKGLPYGMPAENAYVPLRTSFAEFLAAVNDSNSLLYTSRATRTRVAPYYSLDCSAFVSWAWGLESRHMTGALPGVSHNLGRNMQNIQVGDALNKSGVHVVLVTDVQHGGSGEIVSMDILELNPPQAIFTRYGHGGTRPLNDVSRRYLSNGYSILRYRHRESVVYVHDCLVPIDGDVCYWCDATNSPFRDVPHRLVSYDAIEWAYNNGIITGADGKFFPNDTMTRAQFSLMLYRQDGSPQGAENAGFLDVSAERPAFAAINWAHSSAIVTGAHNLFQPDQPITRAQMILMLHRYTELKERDNSSSETSLDHFWDKSDISPVATDAMRWAVTHGLITGTTDGWLLPNNPITRAQVVLILYRFVHSFDS